MNREKKFKAWDCKNQCWVYYLAGEALPENCNDNSLNNWEFTGLKDRNGKEIYEGDIINAGLGEIFYNDKRAKFQVKWHNKVFKNVRGNSQAYQNGEDLFSNSEIAWEVIGNIYENPELLK